MTRHPIIPLSYSIGSTNQKRSYNQCDAMVCWLQLFGVLKVVNHMAVDNEDDRGDDGNDGDDEEEEEEEEVKEDYDDGIYHGSSVMAIITLMMIMMMMMMMMMMIFNRVYESNKKL